MSMPQQGLNGSSNATSGLTLQDVDVERSMGIGETIDWDFLPIRRAITTAICCQQLNRVAQQFKEKQDRIYILHDNARTHVAKSTREKLLQLGWITIPHSPYSPDLAPTDYHLFRSLSHYLSEKKFDDENDLKTALTTFFDQKSLDFYERGILCLPDRWRQVIETDGA